MEEPKLCHCVFPSPTEECLATFEGPTADTALRVLVEPGHEGYVRLQQMSYSSGMGWYVQKTMIIPGEMLKTLITQLRRADCLIPASPRRAEGPLRLVTGPESESEEWSERRGA